MIAALTSMTTSVAAAMTLAAAMTSAATMTSAAASVVVASVARSSDGRLEIVSSWTVVFYLT